MEKKQKQQKRSKTHRPHSNSAESSRTSKPTTNSSNSAAMAHYATYAQATYDMTTSGQGNTVAVGRFPFEGMTEEDIYAMNQANASSIAFTGNLVPSYNAAQQINIDSGYPQMQPGAYLLADNRYPSSSGVHTSVYGRNSQHDQFVGNSGAFQDWNQHLGEPSMSSGGAAAWSSSNIAMNTANFAEYSNTMYGTSPGFPNDTSESSPSQQEGSFRCEVEGCGKLFTRSYNYKAHLETHDERREYPFHCHVDGCDKKFARKTDLQRHHQSVHMKERNHGCAFCGRFFARKDTLRRHMEDGCSKRFDIETIDLDQPLGG